MRSPIPIRKNTNKAGTRNIYLRFSNLFLKHVIPLSPSQRAVMAPPTKGQLNCPCLSISLSLLPVPREGTENYAFSSSSGATFNVPEGCDRLSL